MRMSARLARTVSALMLATAASAQVKKPAADPPPKSVSAASQTVMARPVLTNPDASVTRPPALFKIGNVPLGLWAPVEPPYDAHMNRTQAANPVWEEGGF